jgi:hypothetical protein
MIKIAKIPIKLKCFSRKDENCLVLVTMLDKSHNIYLILSYLVIIGFILYGIFMCWNKTVNFFIKSSKRDKIEIALKLKIPFFWYSVLIFLSIYIIYYITNAIITTLAQYRIIPIIIALTINTILAIAQFLIPLALVKQRHDKILYETYDIPTELLNFKRDNPKTKILEAKATEKQIINYKAFAEELLDNTQDLETREEVLNKMEDIARQRITSIAYN